MQFDLGDALRRFSEEDLIAVIAGEEERVLVANDAFLHLLGHTRDELEAGTVDWVELTPREWGRTDAAMREEILRTGVVGPVLKEYRHRSGRRVPVHLTGVLLSAEPFRWCGVVVEFPGQLAAQREAERSDAMLRSLVREAPVGIAFLDEQLRFLHVNDALARMNGVPASEHPGRTLEEVVPHLARAARPMLERVLATGEALVDIEVSGETDAEPGVRRDWLETMYPVVGSAGPEGVGVVATEVTERRGAERRLRTLIDGLFTFVGLCAPDGTLLEANRTALEVAGLTPGDVLGEPFWETSWWSHDTAVQELVREAVERGARGEPSRFDVEVRARGDRRIVVDFQMVPLVEDGVVTALVPSGVDITERHREVAQLAATAALTRRLSATVTSADVIRCVVEEAPAVFDADSVEIGLCSDHGDLLTVARLEADRGIAYRAIELDDAAPIAAAAASGRIDIRTGLGDREGSGAVPAGLAEYAAVPLRDRGGQGFGAIGIGWSTPRASLPADEARMVTVAELCAQTLVRTRLADDQRDFVSALQDELLPEVPPVPGLEVAVRYRPSSTQLGFGGDWYDVVVLDADRTAVVVGDVAGHGIEAAAQMAQVRGAINAMLGIGIGLDELFATVAAPLARLGEPFLGTAMVAVVDRRAGTVEAVSAGHPPALVRSPDGTVRRLAGGRVRALGRPCGSVRPERAALAPGSALLLFTDGLVERPGEILDEGLDRLAGALAATGPEAPALDALVDAMVDAEQLRDDIAAVAITLR